MSELQKVENAIVGKVLIFATITNQSPLLIGIGKNLSENADIDIAKDEQKNIYIPASGFVGKLKSSIQKLIDDNLEEYYWGSAAHKTSKEFSYQSHIIANNLLSENSSNKINIRDGVRINAATRAAQDGGKYDYEIAEPGIEFYLQMELTIRKNAPEFHKTIQSIYACLHHPLFRIGAYTNHGFGKIAVSNFDAYHFDFNVRKNTEDWFKYLEAINEKNNLLEILQHKPTIKSELTFSQHTIVFKKFTLKLKLKSTMMIGAAARKEDGDTDKGHLRSGDKFVISGKSIRGALRHRADNICDWLNNEDAKKVVNSLFGYTSDDGKTKQKGKLLIEEIHITNGKSFLQTRIKIDRFTGGTIKGVLFSSAPLTTGDEIEMVFYVQGVGNSTVKDAEMGLLMLLIKDLYTENLAIGGEKNIGRGIFTGIELMYNDKIVYKEKVVDNVLAKEMNDWVTAFNNYQDQRKNIEHAEKQEVAL